MAAGFQRVHFYVTPSFSVNPREQAKYIFGKLKENDLLDQSLVWFDIQNPSFYSNSCPNNIKFIQEWLDEASKQQILGNAGVGLFTDVNGWTKITCYTYQIFGHSFMWYPGDDSQSFDDFVPFANMIYPVMKQNKNRKNMCGTVVNTDYY